MTGEPIPANLTATTPVVDNTVTPVATLVTQTTANTVTKQTPTNPTTDIAVTQNVSVLTGLFTDKATSKLSEIFEVVFGLKNGDKRTDKLTSTIAKILFVTPDKLLAGVSNTIIVKGENLDKEKL